DSGVDRPDQDRPGCDENKGDSDTHVFRLLSVKERTGSCVSAGESVGSACLDTGHGRARGAAGFFLPAGSLPPPRGAPRRSRPPPRPRPARAPPPVAPSAPLLRLPP